jgi:hypothetical protein
MGKASPLCHVSPVTTPRRSLLKLRQVGRASRDGRGGQSIDESTQSRLTRNDLLCAALTTLAACIFAQITFLLSCVF